jgi:hypothetical protein
MASVVDVSIIIKSYRPLSVPVLMRTKYFFQKLRSRLKEKVSGKVTDRELDDCFNIVKDQVRIENFKIIIEALKNC